MNDKNSETTTFETNPKRSTRKTDPVLTAEQFSRWLEKSLDELEEQNSEFATANSNRHYFSR